MAALITVNGNVEEIIAFARTLEAGVHTEKTGLLAEERAYVNADNIINAIRLYRARSGCGLKEAKDFVEASPEGRAYLGRFRR